ncbi:TPA: prepilin-type cleavage/methylation domain-containing protein, partial [Neisseria gonorrhoeae]
CGQPVKRANVADPNDAVAAAKDNAIDTKHLPSTCRDPFSAS